MTIEEHIKNLKAIASDMPSDKCADWIESLMAGINAMEELKSHREAWEKAKRTVKAYLMLEGFGSAYQYDIEKLIEECRPKEGDMDD